MSLFGTLIDGMTALINSLYGFTLSLGIPSYALAIIMLTVLIKLVLYPLTRIQMRSMMSMQLLQPEIQELQKKYAKDKQMLQVKMMELYKERKVNPMAGCLLLLAQMPFLIALYRALWDFNYVDTAHAGFFWLETLSMQDPTYILPILAGVTTYFQSKMTMPSMPTSGEPNPAQQTQKMMLVFLPFFIGWISSTLPAGLSVYWVTFNLMGILQQYFINKQMIPVRQAALAGPAGNTELGEIDQAEIEAEPAKREQKNESKKTGAGQQPKSAKGKGKGKGRTKEEAAKREGLGKKRQNR
ncbi:MAG: YidC/Oxa1 family membrane protein insertase [Clostridia bacterium]|nr:YidC/Oxa1 family membrane protein insertase [Clostridia bacterium]